MKTETNSVKIHYNMKMHLSGSGTSKYHLLESKICWFVYKCSL